MICVVFFKQKTAYELRISDWSSDVCSSDLALLEPIVLLRRELRGPIRSTRGSRRVRIARLRIRHGTAGSRIERPHDRRPGNVILWREGDPLRRLRVVLIAPGIEVPRDVEGLCRLPFADEPTTDIDGFCHFIVASLVFMSLVTLSD